MVLNTAKRILEMRMSNNPWDILGITQTASDDELRQAYKKQAFRYHPDKPTGDEEYFKLIHSAYQQLRNRTHVPILTKPDTKLVNLTLSIKQQIEGVSDIIDTVEGFALSVKIPAGAVANEKFKIKHAGKNYIINIKEKANKHFTRQGLNVIMYLDVDIVTAMTGGIITIEGPDENDLEIYIPAGSRDNNLIVIENMGLLDRKKRRRGNLNIFLKIEIPVLNTDEEINNFVKRLKK